MTTGSSVYVRLISVVFLALIIFAAFEAVRWTNRRHIAAKPAPPSTEAPEPKEEPHKPPDTVQPPPNQPVKNHQPPKHREKPPSEIADEVVKKLQDSQVKTDNIQKIRIEATSVIRGLDSIFQRWQDQDRFWQGLIGENPTEAHRGTIQRSRDYNNDQLTQSYRKNYRARVVNVRDSLLGRAE